MSQSIAINNGATAAQQSLAISDKNLPSSASNTITGLAGHYGVAVNLGGGLPAQAAINGIVPTQPVGGLGTQLGAIYATGVNAYANNTSTALQNTVSLLTKAYSFSSSDLGVAKNYFANGTINGTVTAVAPSGYTLPTFNGLPNTANSVYDLAYGVNNTQAGQNIYGDSRPAQVAPTQINGFDPTALQGISTNPSFPSGHTNYAYTDSILLGMLVPQQYQSMLSRASEYANSRIVLGVHYPLDIIASRAFAQYDLAQAFTNPAYINNATTTGTALNLPSLFNAANSELNGYLATNCGASVATCAASSANTTNNPYVDSAANLATYTANLTYGLPTLSFTAAPREAAPAGGPDASILLAPLYGGSTSAAQAIAPTGGLYGSLQTGTINQIIVNTETNALASFYGTSLSYWARINLLGAADYFQNTSGVLTLASTDVVTTPVTVGSTGVLVDNGSINAATTISSGGVLGGTGSVVGTTTVLSGGTLAPGVYNAAGTATGPGTLSVTGNLTFNSGSTYAVQVNAASASQTTVSGTATLGNATVAPTLPANATTLAKRYTILTAGGLNGTFGTLSNTNLSPNFTDTVSYDATHAYLNFGINFAGSGGTGVNRQNLGNAFNAVLNGTGTLPIVYATLTPTGQSQASGETATGGQSTSYNAMGQFTSLLMTGSGIGGPGAAGAGEPFGYAATRSVKADTAFEAVDADLGQRSKVAPLAAVLDPHWAIWTQGYGGGERISGSSVAGSSTTTARVWGLAVGADSYISPTTTLGFGIGGGGTNYGLSNSLGSGKSDMFQAGLTATQRINAAYLSGAIAYGWQDVTTTRQVTASGVDTLQARFRTNSLSERAEFGNRYDYMQVGVTPYVAGQLTTLFLPSYTETVVSGGPAFALSYGSKTVTDPRTELGVRLDKAFAIPDGTWTLKSSLAYVYDYNTSRSINATFQALPGASFTVNGARPAPSSALVTLGSDIKWTNGVSVGAVFKGEFSATTAAYEAKGVVKYEW